MNIQIKENKYGFLLPFYLNEMNEIKRFFIIKNKKAGDIRGNHAHKKDFQTLVLLNGKCEIEYENKNEKGKKELLFGKPYYSKPLEWLKINMIDENTIILVFCTQEYDEEEYIRNYEQFTRIINDKVRSDDAKR